MVMSTSWSVLVSFSVAVAVLASLPEISILVITPTIFVSSARAMPLIARRPATSCATTNSAATAFFMMELPSSRT